MPLSQNDPSLDYDGSWGVASAKWPYLMFASEEDARKAYVACWKECKIPYGCSVLVDNTLRLETKEQRRTVGDYMQSIGVKVGFGDAP